MHCPECTEPMELVGASTIVDDYAGGDRQLTALIDADELVRVYSCFGCGFWAPWISPHLAH